MQRRWRTLVAAMVVATSACSGGDSASTTSDTPSTEATGAELGSSDGAPTDSPAQRR